MARLNEVPVAGESVEALKRRFIRQNREIARSNSTQSLRIRTLEAETSRLLSENITLREENIKLRHEIERGQSKLALDQVGAAKEKLEAKLVELCNLVADLGKTPPEPSPLHKRANRRTSRRSSSEKNWRSTFSLAEAAIDGRLPPIAEDKYYPRRTLDDTELQAVFIDPADITDSPVLGPPPTSHFYEGDPVQHASTQADQPGSPSIGNHGQNLEIQTVTDDPFANLETRKKRREGVSHKDVNHESSNVSKSHLQDPFPSILDHPLRVGAKRKLSVRESDEQASLVSSDKEDFAFSRRSSTMVKDGMIGRGSHESSEAKKSGEVSRENSRETIKLAANRKALGEKSVNTDPINSPIKSRTGDGNRLKHLDKDSRNSRLVDKTIDKSAVIKVVRPALLPKNPEVTSISSADLPHVTPAPVDLALLSPTASEPSNAHFDSRDTPPPADLASESTNTVGRPSRRQRAAVSYAEPNLRDKMRRPTKELVDAVSSDVKITRVQSTKHNDDNNRAASEHLNSERSPAPTYIKQEEDRDDQSQWKSLPSDNSRAQKHAAEPTSPLSKKPSLVDSDASGLPSTVLTDRRRRSSLLLQQQQQQQQQPPHEPFDPNPVPAKHAFSTPTAHQASLTSMTAAPLTTSSSNSTIAALVAGSQKRLSRAREAAAARGHGQHLSLSDIREKGKDLKLGQDSGQDRGNGKGDGKDIFEITGSGPDMRGENSVVSGKETRKAEAKGRRMSSVEQGGSVRGRRRETMVSTNSSGDGIVATESKETGGRHSKPSGNVLGSGGGKDDTIGRAERAAMRRRSMVL